MSGSRPVALPSDVQRALTLYHDIEQYIDARIRPQRAIGAETARLVHDAVLEVGDIGGLDHPNRLEL
jgi:hypothetical protein